MGVRHAVRPALEAVRTIFSRGRGDEAVSPAKEEITMAKKVKTQIKLQIPAGGANPAPPVGPALGQHGVNIMDFCKQFNERTKSAEAGMTIPVVITVFEDRTFTFI